MRFIEIFKKVGRAVKSLFSKKATIEKAFDNCEICISSTMMDEISLWKSLYACKPPWIGEDSKVKKTMNTAVGIAGELARLSTMELESEISGDSQMATFLNEEYQKILKKAENYVEFACAMGGVVLKPYVVPDKGTIEVSIIQADEFYVTHYEDNGTILGAIFPDQKIISGKKYTRLERHEFVGNKYVIENKAFVVEIAPEAMTDTEDSLGRECPLEEVPDWAGIQPIVTLDNVEHPLFAYLRMPIANNKDSRSPLGVSVFSRAVEALQEVDVQYSRILWEYKATEAAVFADQDILPTDSKGNVDLDATEERLYRKLDGFEKQMEAYNPDIRSDPLFKGLDKHLKHVEFLCNLAYGTISDPQTVDKTAEEVKSAKQRSFSMVTNIQANIEEAHEELVYAMYVQAVLYGLAPNGAYEVIHDFGDSINSDREVEFKRRMAMAAAGMLRPELVVAWYFQCSEEEALKMMPNPITEEDGPEEE